MKNLQIVTRIWLVIVILSLILAQGPIVLAGEPVSVDVAHTYKSFWDQDSIQNSLIFWEGLWSLGIYNPSGSGVTVVNPKMILQSPLAFSSFFPDDPAVFTADPAAGIYTWDLQGINIPPGVGQPAYAHEEGDEFEENARFTVKRTVSPEILTQDTTAQTVRVEFKLDEPLPDGVDVVSVGIGDVTWAYGHYPLVKISTVSQNNVTGWHAYVGEGGPPIWEADYQDVQIGQTYTFEAVVNLTKTEYLIGSPRFKPQVEVHYTKRARGYDVVFGKEVTIDYSPDISGIFSNNVNINWVPVIYPIPAYIFHLNPYVSETTPPPPPFHVLVDAKVKIRPKCINTRSRGRFTVFIRLPDGYSVRDIKKDTVGVEGARAIWGKIHRKKYIAKFKKKDLRHLDPGYQELVVRGELKDGTVFEGNDVVRVME